LLHVLSQGAKIKYLSFFFKYWRDKNTVVNMFLIIYEVSLEFSTNLVQLFIKTINGYLLYDHLKLIELKLDILSQNWAKLPNFLA